MFVNFSLEKMSDYLASTRCRIALLRGERSVVVPPGDGEYMYEPLNRSAPLVEIPEAYHHLLLDQPLAFIAAVRALLADWEHSVPRGGDSEARSSRGLREGPVLDSLLSLDGQTPP